MTSVASVPPPLPLAAIGVRMQSIFSKGLSMTTLDVQAILDGIREDAFREGARQMRAILADYLDIQYSEQLAASIATYWPTHWGCDPGPWTEDSPPEPPPGTFAGPDAPTRTFFGQPSEPHQ